MTIGYGTIVILLAGNRFPMTLWMDPALDYFLPSDILLFKLEKHTLTRSHAVEIFQQQTCSIRTMYHQVTVSFVLSWHSLFSEKRFMIERGEIGVPIY